MLVDILWTVFWGPVDNTLSSDNCHTTLSPAAPYLWKSPPLALMSPLGGVDNLCVTLWTSYTPFGGRKPA